MVKSVRKIAHCNVDSGGCVTRFPLVVLTNIKPKGIRVGGSGFNINCGKRGRNVAGLPRGVAADEIGNIGESV